MKNEKGFSLIELIIVIGIMAVIVAAIVPNLTKYLKKSQMQADANNKDEIKKVIERACGQIGAQVAEPILNQWISFEEGSVYYDTSKISVYDENGAQNFAGFVASEISKIPKTKMTNEYFKVKITKNVQGIYEVEVQ